MADPNDPMGVQQQPQGPMTNVQNFFKDPKNLATGLVFLAALAQGRRPGQSTAGQVGERALGALAFRGGIDSSQRKQKIQDDQLAEQKLQQSKDNEFKNRQVAIGEQGLDLQRSGQSQAARLAADENASRERTAVAEGASEIRLRDSQARLNDRTDPNLRSGSGSGANDDPTGSKTIHDLMVEQWKAEVADAQLNGRTPDPMKLINSVGDLLQANSVMQPGASLVRNPDGSIARYVAKPSEALAPPGQPGGPTPSAAPPSVFLTPGDLEPKPRPKRAPTAVERQQNASTHESSQLGTEAQGFQKAEDVDKYIKKYGKVLSSAQLKALMGRKRELLKEVSRGAADGGVL